MRGSGNGGRSELHARSMSTVVHLNLAPHSGEAEEVQEAVLDAEALAEVRHLQL